MSYAATNWATGDVITAEKLNNIENGIENASDSVFMVTITYFSVAENTFKCDKTWNEVKEAYENKKRIIFQRKTSGDDNTAFFKFYKVISAIRERVTGAITSLSFNNWDASGTSITIEKLSMSSNDASLERYVYKMT